MTKRMIAIALTLIVASAALVAQDVTVAGVNVPQLVASSLAATERHWQERSHYTYMTRVESRRRDMQGNLKSQDVEISETTLTDHVPFEHLLERNGQPLSAREERRQTRARDELKHETPAQRADRLREDNAEVASLREEVPKAFDFHVVGQEVVHGRAAYVLRITPRAGYEPRGTYAQGVLQGRGHSMDRHAGSCVDQGGRPGDRAVLDRIVPGAVASRFGGDDGADAHRRRDMAARTRRVRAAATILLVKSIVIERE